MTDSSMFTQADHDALLNHVFPELLSNSKSSEWSLTNLSEYIKQTISDSIDEAKINSALKAFNSGRLGPTKVQLDSETNIGGQVLLDQRRQLVVGHSSFSTARANCCVYSGKWCYETRLCTGGLMQIGWCTLKCTFSRENGVGDTPNSFSYDGSRVRKWNAKFGTYGEPWLPHDVITCCIDCDEGVVSFYRNGRSLGVAFDNVRLGPGVAYFPALSVARGQAAFLNFGDVPFAYPIPEDYQPLQAPPLRLETRLVPVLSHLERLIPLAADTRNDALSATKVTGASLQEPVQPAAPMHSGNTGSASNVASAGVSSVATTASSSATTRSRDSTCWLIASHLVPLIEQGLTCDYTVAKYILPLMAKFSDIDCLPQARQCHLEVIVQYICTFLQRDSCQRALASIVSALFATCHSHPSPDYAHQRTCLTILLAMLRHDCARRYLVSSVLFDTVELPVFCFVNQLPELLFTKEPHIFEDSKREKYSNSPHATPSIAWRLGPSAQSRLADYQASISKVDDLIQEMLRTLMNHTDGTLSIFADRLHEFVRDNMSPDTVSMQPAVLRDCCPQHAMPAFFHALVRTIQSKWNGTPEMAPFEQQPYIPAEYFCLEELDSYDAQRLGGLQAYLAKTYKDEVSAVLRSSATLAEQYRQRGGFGAGLSSLGDSAASSGKRRFVGGLGALLTFTGRGGSGGGHKEGSSPTAEQQQASATPPSPSTPAHPQQPLGPAMLAEFGCRHLLPPSSSPAGTSAGSSPTATFLDERQQLLLQMHSLSSQHHRRHSRRQQQQQQQQQQQLQQSLILPLIRLLDCTIALFYLSVYRQLVLASKRLLDYASYCDALDQTRANLARCPPDRLADIGQRIEAAERVLRDHLIGREAALAHLLAGPLSPEMRASVRWLCSVLSATFAKAAGAGGEADNNNLFRFLPEYFVSTAANAFYTLKDVCGLLVPFQTAEDSAEILLSFARFITAYFDDPRIVSSETRELFLSNLVVLTCEPDFIEALQRFSQDEAASLVKSLLLPASSDSGYSRRWFLTNRVLVRFWKGDGFAFRYAEEPDDLADASGEAGSAGGSGGGGDLMKQLAANRLFNTTPTPKSFDLDPYPSAFYQRQIRALLVSDPALQRQIVDFLLNKLNLSFSDYLSVSQDSRNAASAAGAAISSRRAKVLSGFLDMTVVLVRALEMVAHLTPEFFVQPTSSLFLSRLSQVAGQIMLRLPSICGATGLFPLLAGVCGLLRELTAGSGSASSAATRRQTVLSSLKSEACLNSRTLTKVYEVLAAYATKGDEEGLVTSAELEFVKQLGEDLDSLVEDSELTGCSEDDLCPICYAHKLSVVFKPCGHRSCGSCIALQLSNKRECFFCKAAVKKVEDFSGNQIKM
uniref:B30.2/SPRY domain-containing protein n=1 Tax=Macrostomum lignano TaxID=282301 RepID=A0A1I8I723_9PLAT